MADDAADSHRLSPGRADGLLKQIALDLAVGIAWNVRDLEDVEMPDWIIAEGSGDALQQLGIAVTGVGDSDANLLDLLGIASRADADVAGDHVLPHPGF